MTFNAYLPAYLVGYPPLTAVTDAAPVADFDTGYPPLCRTPLPASGAWREGDDPGERQFANIGPLQLELGGVLPAVTLAYETWGTLNADGTNAILLCHALTGDSHATSQDGHDGWWKDIVGPGKAIDTRRWYVVCPNVLGAAKARPGRPRSPGWPTVGLPLPRDHYPRHVRRRKRLAEHLGVEHWALVAGASFGGNRVMEWAASYPDMSGAIAVLVVGAATTAEQIAYQRRKTRPSFWIRPSMAATTIICPTAPAPTAGSAWHANWPTSATAAPSNSTNALAAHPRKAKIP